MRAFGFNYSQLRNKIWGIVLTQCFIYWFLYAFKHLNKKIKIICFKVEDFGKLRIVLEKLKYNIIFYSILRFCKNYFMNKK